MLTLLASGAMLRELETKPMARYRTLNLTPEVAARIEQAAKAENRTLRNYVETKLDPWLHQH